MTDDEDRKADVRRLWWSIAFFVACALLLLGAGAVGLYH